MAHYLNKYSQSIYEILEPMIGDYIARAVIKSQTSAIGLKDESISKKDLPLLAERIKNGLVIFLGNDIASKVATKITQIQ